ncbi:MAG: hypothetical protein PHW25_00640 [Zoogloea sp.]|uniref:hypothetical protein n=1 Tax=Zoogloea sp. TaxID=49181 RepID=UPI002611EBDB|nr:hypothetical protein [Zoogloea sp.]MDD3325574.1 hypothetical protein [Zoogloea sp.]
MGQAKLSVFDALLRWISESSRASRLARLATQGLELPPRRDAEAERWREDMGESAPRPELRPCQGFHQGEPPA